MAEERAQRRLAAILAADVVGYSRLMSEDEQGTLNALNLHRAEFIHPTVSNYRGRIVKLMGDGALVEFPSVIDAVECAVAVQRGIAERNADTPENKRITFRIGINLGDIIIDGDDIYGDGVNIAARLEAEADPGGICISDDAYRQVFGKIDIAFEDLGERKLKNMAVPVRAYRWQRAAAVRPAAEKTSLQPPSDKPSIAVLPFDNMSGDTEQEYFSDGLAEDLITDLSKISGLFVIARNSAFAFKGQQINPRQVAEQLGVRYVLEGSVRKAGGRVRINAQFIDAHTGGHLWAERYDGDLDDVFSLQDNIAAQIVSALQISLTPAEKSETRRHLTESVEAYELFLQARTLFYQFTPKTSDESVRLYKQAIDADPEFAAAYANLSMVLQTGWSFMFPGYDDALGQALRCAEKAVEIDDTLGLALARLGWVQVFTRQFDEATKNFERALELSPNDADVYAYFAMLLNWVGDPERAIDMIKESVRFDPLLPPNCAFHWGDSLFLLRRYDEAIEKISECIAKAPGFAYAQVDLAVIYSELGRYEEAAAALDAARLTLPGNKVRMMVDRLPLSEEVHTRIIEGLRQAGLPDSR